MAAEPNPALRAEIQAAVDTLVPQVRGLEYFLKISVLPAAVRAIGDELQVRKRRLDCLDAVLGALDAVISKLNALYADGYPTFKPNDGTQAVFQEIQDEEAALVLAANLFRAGAASIGLDEANVVHRPQPIPAA